MEKSKDIIKLFIGFIIFFFIGKVFSLVVLNIFNISLKGIGMKEYALIECVLSLVLVIVFSILYFDTLKYSFSKSKEKQIKQIISGVVIGILFMYLARFAAGIIESVLAFIAGVELGNVDNQSIIEEMLKSAPIITIISGCLLGPMEEELLFRGGVGKLLKNKKVFIAVSALIFGLIHVTDSVLLIGEIVLIGFVIETILERNNNKKSRLMLSVISTVLILLVFGVAYYFKCGNLITVIKSLDLNEVIGSISYILNGFVLALIYINNDRNLIINILIHMCVNTLSVLIALCLL